jgi:hypothetical protein
MTYFVIIDSTANLVESFDNEADARDALKVIVRSDPESAYEYAMLKIDDSGMPFGDALMGSELNTPV